MSDEALKKIHELFKDFFIQNCTLDEDEVNDVELETLNALEPEEIYENLKELLSTLFSFKKSIKSSDVKDLAQRLIIFEKMIQKLESDIRKHISIHHQMRLETEAYEYKIDELQKIKAYHIKKIDELDKMVIDKEAKILHIKNKNAVDLELKLKGIENMFKHEICNAVHLYSKEGARTTRNMPEKTVKDIIEEKDKEIKKLRLEKNFLHKELQLIKGRKSKLPKIPKETLTERTKRNSTTPNEPFKTIESIPKKNKKHESPFLHKDLLHYRSTSDLGSTQKAS
ncbi:hypothetical protein SteCoe_19454 [Stentor coeruleus]|uniref:Uncharacterized protein n=1 Tax=Stentor coeruleus TaxID=5963 RepID=A0A1R2BU11_9CILI|nr:hypothetical protein SteCoe_19454 [Stentor coeruleus]